MSERAGEDEGIELGEIERVRLAPGDVVVFRCRRTLTPVAAGQIEDELKRIFGVDKVLVLGGDSEVSIVTREPDGKSGGAIARFFRRIFRG